LSVVTPDSFTSRYVIGIAGPVGGGKSTLVRQLANLLAGATPIHFDDYESLTSQPIEKIKQWMQSGGDTSELPVAGLAADLVSLKAGRAVSIDATSTPVPVGRYILFETQFGRRHAATGMHIDFLVWMDTPLDIALARKLRQFNAELAGTINAADHAAFSEWLRVYLDNYLDVVGELLRVQRNTVAAEADLVIDGATDRESIARQVKNAILGRFG
jgi:uridine kinase